MKSTKAISADALRLLTQYDFLGNVRELENAIERAFRLKPRNCYNRATCLDRCHQ